jgi:predicted RNase H-like nuclease (RuvC/YqgF family)
MFINNNNYISNTGANTLLTNNNVNSTDVKNADSNNNSNNNSGVNNNTNMSAISFKNNAQNSEVSIINEQNNFQNMINQQINSLTYSIEKISRDVKTLLNNQVMINNEISSLKSIVEQFIQGAKSENNTSNIVSNNTNVSSYNVIFRRDCKTQTLLNIEVKENDNVETLMSKYKNKSNYNGNIKLLFNAKILENEQTCKDIGLINGSTIYVLDFEILKGA